MATTIGSIGLSNKACIIGDFENKTELEVNLRCRSGHLDFNRSLIAGVMNSNEKECYFVTKNHLVQDSAKLDTLK